MVALVPRYNPTQTVEARAPTPVRASMNGLGGLAAGIDSVGDLLNDWQDGIDTAAAKDADNQFSDLIRRELYEDGTGFMYSQGNDALGARDSVSQRLEKAQRDLLAGLTPFARSKAESAITARYQRALQTIDQHSAGQRRVYMDTASAARVESSIQNAIYNPDTVATEIAVAEREILEMADRNGWAPEVIAQKQIEARTKIHSGIIGRLEAVDPVQALNYLRSNRDKMSGDEVVRMERLLVPKVKEYRGRQAGQIAAMSGVSDTYLAAIRQAESGGNDSAKNPLSTATGRYQFIESTWNELMRRHPNLGLTAGGRLDPAQQERAIRAFTRENAETLQRNGIPPTNGNLYAAHFLGAGGAVSVLKAADTSLVSSIVGEGVIAANPFLKGMSVANFKAWANRKGGGNTIGYSPSAGGIESLLGISDPVERAAAIREYKLQSGIKDYAETRAREAATQSAYEAIENGGSWASLSSDIKDAVGLAAAGALQRYEAMKASGQPIETDYRLFVDIYDQIATDPKTFMKDDPYQHRDKLSDSDFKTIVKIRSQMIADGLKPPKVSGVALSRFKGSASIAMEAAGIDLDANKDILGQVMTDLMSIAASKPDVTDTDLFFEASQLVQAYVSTAASKPIKSKPLTFSAAQTRAKAALEDAGIDVGDNKPLRGEITNFLLEYSANNPLASESELREAAERAAARIVIPGTFGFGRVDNYAVSIDFGGRTVDPDDDLSPQKFRDDLLAGNLKINGTYVDPGMAQQVITDFQSALKRQPTPRELLDLIIAKML